ncbi:MAG TPA: rhodanese-like domain-containing protein [Alloacidobacterium sp.]|nr:rhodanese-like domain-containing protein [Alloacidobacterium sp.]
MYSGYMLDYEITPSQLASILAEPEREQVVLLDVREPAEHAVARIEGSILMPMGDVPGRANHELDPDVHIVAICHHGVRSMNVAVWLRNQGFEKTQSLRGGIDAWSALVDPTIARY